MCAEKQRMGYHRQKIGEISPKIAVLSCRGVCVWEGGQTRPRLPAVSQGICVRTKQWLHNEQRDSEITWEFLPLTPAVADAPASLPLAVRA